MTRITDAISNFIYEPKTKYPIDSPLYWRKTDTIEQLWERLGLKGWSEVEVRFLHKDGTPAYRIEGEKSNFVIIRYVKEKYPTMAVTFEASANMLEFDTWLCLSHKDLISWLQYIQLIKEDILHHFDLIEWPAFVDEKELEYDFINPIHDNVLNKYEEFGQDLERLTQFLQDIPETQKAFYGLDFTSPERTKYLLTIQAQLPKDIIKFTKTTAQQLTLSTDNFSNTLWLDQQLLNYITTYYYTNNQSYEPWTNKRGKQWEEVVTYRSLHKIGVKWWYRPIAPWSVYYAYLKRTYFDNKQIDWFSLWHVPSAMSHGPISLKFALDENGELIPRTEFRLQDSMPTTLDAQERIDTMLMDFAQSAYAQFPKYEYTKTPTTTL